MNRKDLGKISVIVSTYNRWLKTEEIYMEQNNKRMHEATDPLYFVIAEKLNSCLLYTSRLSSHSSISPASRPKPH